MAAIEAMGKIRDRGSSVAFLDTRTSRFAARKVIADVNHKDAVAILWTAADDPNPAVRRWCCAMMKLDSRL